MSEISQKLKRHQKLFFYYFHYNMLKSKLSVGKKQINKFHANFTQFNAISKLPCKDQFK